MKTEKEGEMNIYNEKDEKREIERGRKRERKREI